MNEKIWRMIDGFMAKYKHRIIVDNYHLKKRLSGQSRDYVRLSTLELFSREVMRENIPGNCAELGVYRGGTRSI